ncbi:hypothetical protein F4604DRAFT_1953660 [Suillus subluteus]|nr:hypothetical protein F4604DRAFT_1953660 [Suillus subluteus]
MGTWCLTGDTSSVHKQQEEKEDASEGNIWLKTDCVVEAQKQAIFENISVNDGFMHWGKDTPETRIVKHVAGRITMCNGTVFIVTDSPSSFLSLSSIASADNSHEAPLPGEWVMLSEQARDILGTYGGLPFPSATTSVLPTHKGIQPDLDGPIIRRQRSDSSIFSRPLFHYSAGRLTDFGATAHSAHNVPPFVLLLVGLDASKEWWEPNTQNIAKFLHFKSLPQWSTLLKRNDFEVNIVFRGTLNGKVVSRRPVQCKSASLVKVILVVYGDSLADSVSMRSSGHSALAFATSPGGMIGGSKLTVFHLLLQGDLTQEAQIDPASVVHASHSHVDIVGDMFHVIARPHL